MRIRNLYLLILLFFLCSITAVAQQKINGVVRDAKGKGLEGVSILLKGGTGKRILTDNEGKFTIPVPDGGKKLVLITALAGYIKTETNVTAGQDVVVILKPAPNKGADEVVIIGYQSVSRKVSTAAVSTIKGKEIENRPIASFDQLLQGRAAGLNVQNYSGAPGVRTTLNLRGNTNISRSVDGARALSSPLFVVDGVVLSSSDLEGNSATGTNFLAGINPNDIESIDILKDAAATGIYGSRGGDGVVIVKTKRGKSGIPKINLNIYTGISQRPKLNEYIVGAEERRVKLAYLKQTGNYQQLADLPIILTDSLNPSFNNNTDWQGLFYRSGIIKNVDLSVSGAKEGIDYRFASNYFDEQGIIKGSGYKRYSFNGNVGAQMTQKFRFEAQFRLSRAQREAAQNLPQTNGLFPSSLIYLSELDRQRLLNQYAGKKDDRFDEEISMSLTARYNPILGLDISSSGSFYKSTGTVDQFTPSALDIYENKFYVYSNSNNNINYNVDNLISYSKTFNTNHNFNILAGNTINSTRFTGAELGGFGYGNNVVSTITNIVPSNITSFGTSITESGLLSFFGRLNYDYKRKYSFSASWRADASSRFGKNFRWGYFPTVSAAWIVTGEPFMNNVKWVNSLKIRASYGKSGSLPNSFYGPYNVYRNNNTYGGVTGVIPDPNSITQDNLTWVSTPQTNIGLDAEFLNSRINLTFDAYNRETKGALFDYLLPITTGYDKAQTNAVDLRNAGLEVTLTGNIFKPTRKFQWQARVIASFNSNQIAKLPNGNRDIIVGGDTYILTKGRAIYEFYLIHSLGVFTNNDQVPFDPITGKKLTYWGGYVSDLQAGDYHWQDQNFDYDVWSSFDRVRAGDPTPKITGGLTNTFSYKNFSLEVFSSFVLKRTVNNNYISNLLETYISNRGYDYANTSLIDFNKYPIWQSSKDVNAKYAKVDPYNHFYYQFLNFSDAYLENGAYLRIQSLSLGYLLPEKFVKRIKMQNINVYATMTNLHTFQSSTLPDVTQVDELGNYSGNGYTIPHKFTFGINVSF